MRHTLHSNTSNSRGIQNTLNAFNKHITLNIQLIRITYLIHTIRSNTFIGPNQFNTHNTNNDPNAFAHTIILTQLMHLPQSVLIN